MRLSIVSAAVLTLSAAAAHAADLPIRALPYRPAPVAAVRIVPVMPLAPAPLWLECSPYTAEPITVVYNEPGRAPWSVRPDLTLVPLGGAKPFKTRAVYPRGY